ncbi:phosphoglycerate mutase-like protein [Hypoxylon fuscum]|nr:phosphoglycerate mutase-like protein [Hypoxylon fuscum]
MRTPSDRAVNAQVSTAKAPIQDNALTTDSHNASQHVYKFSSVPDFFEDYAKIAESSPDGKASTQPALGILKRDYGGPNTDPELNEEAGQQWIRFASYITHLNKQHPNDGISYKLMYVIRHGRGVHNVKMDELKLSEEAGQLETYDGKPKNWKNYWSRLDGDGKVIWSDAKLVEEGEKEAQELASLLFDEAQKDALPLPGSIYTSPLARCLETTRLVYESVMAKRGKCLQAIVKENLRERITDHTCDRRSSRSWIESNYPKFIIEQGFSESDTSWKADKAESLEQHIARAQQLLDDIFANDTSPIISLTTHSYAITAILAVIGHPKFLVNEGTIVPLFVKAEKAASNASLS